MECEKIKDKIRKNKIKEQLESSKTKRLWGKIRIRKRK